MPPSPVIDSDTDQRYARTRERQIPRLAGHVLSSTLLMEVIVYLGAVIPQTNIGANSGAVRAFAQTVEELGYHHLV
jgi:hypothetical protein